MHIFIAAILILFSAFFSGANLGLMSLNPYELLRKMELGDEESAKIYAVRRRGNLLLVTLLLGNVAVISILSIYLSSLTSGVVAALISTALITVFGEILPQALFSRYRLFIGARIAWFVQWIMWLLYPICAPIAWLLDKSLGQELPTVYSKEELVKIVEEHHRTGMSEIEADDERIVRGALTFGDKLVGDIMTPWSVVHTLQESAAIDDKLLTSLNESGFSRFPVVNEKGEIAQILFLRDLSQPQVIGRKVLDIARKPVYFVNETEQIDVALQAFIKLKHHLFVVVNEFVDLVGVLSIEDVLEEIIGEEIVGEFDSFADMRLVAAKLPKPKNLIGPK